MIIEKITAETELKSGDLLLIAIDTGVAAYTIKQILQLVGMREVILNRRKNTYFNLEMYLAGESWVKDARIVRAP